MPAPGAGKAGASALCPLRRRPSRRLRSWPAPSSLRSCHDLQSSCERTAQQAGVVSRCAELLAPRDDAAQEAMGGMLGREGDAAEDLKRTVRDVERRAAGVRLRDRRGPKRVELVLV